MTDTINGLDLAVRDVPGVGRVAYLLPTIPDGAPDGVREGFARRRLVAITGQCPCGATQHLPNRAERRRLSRQQGLSGDDVDWFRAEVEHEADCPAVDDTLLAAIRAWQVGA